MKLRDLLYDDRGVAPVIAVILMVAIVVTLAGFAATTFMSIGEQGTNTEPTPPVVFSMAINNYDDTREDELIITHESGQNVDVGPAASESITPGELYIIFSERYEDDTSTAHSGFECPHDGNPDHWECPFNFNNDERVTGDDPTTMKAGDSFTVYAVEPDDEFADATGKVVFKPEGSDVTYTIAEFEGPDA